MPRIYAYYKTTAGRDGPPWFFIGLRAVSGRNTRFGICLFRGRHRGGRCGRLLRVLLFHRDSTGCLTQRIYSLCLLYTSPSFPPCPFSLKSACGHFYERVHKKCSKMLKFCQPLFSQAVFRQGPALKPSYSKAKKWPAPFFPFSVLNCLRQHSGGTASRISAAAAQLRLFPVLCRKAGPHAMPTARPLVKHRPSLPQCPRRRCV